MFDLLSPELRPFIGVTGLALVFLAFASLIQRMQRWQEQKYARSQRLMRGARILEHVRQSQGSFALPRDVSTFCDNELLVRYRMLAAMVPGLEGIEERIRQAERDVRGDGHDSRPDRSPEDIGDLAQLEAYGSALSALLEFFATQRPVTDATGARVGQLRERLRILRAQVYFRLYYRRVLASAREGDWRDARSAAAELVEWQRIKAPPNPDGDEVYRQAVELYRYISCRQLPTAVPADQEVEPGRAGTEG
jgi:hypothetical protein